MTFVSDEPMSDFSKVGSNEERVDRIQDLIGNPKRKREIQLRIILEDRTLKGDLILKTILR